MKKVFNFIVYILLFYTANAQLDTIGLPIITNYGPNDYHGHYQNWNAIQDDDGIIYIANGEGVLTFDGVNWEFIYLTNSKTPRSLYKSPEGKIYVGGDDVFGYLSADSIGRIKFIDLSSKIPQEYRDYKIIWKILGDKNNIYLLTTKYLFIISESETKTIQSKRNFYRAITNGDNLYLNDGRVIYKYKKDSLIKIPFEETIIDFFNRNDTTFIFSENKIVFFIDKKDNIKKYSKIDIDFSSSNISNLNIYKNKYIIFTTLNNGFYISDFYGKEKFHFKKEQGIISNSIYSFLIDNKENIWLSTSSGISYIEINSPIRMIDNRFGFEYSNILFFNNFNNKIYTCTGFKVYEILLKHTQNVKFNELTDNFGQNWNSLEINNELYISSNPGIIRLDQKGKTKKIGPNSNVWEIIKVPNTENDYLIGAMVGLFYYKYDGDSLKFQKLIPNFNYSARELFFDSKGNLWVGVSNNGVFKIKLSDNYDIEEIFNYDATKGLTNTSTIVFFEWNNKILFSFTINSLITNILNTNLLIKFETNGGQTNE